MTPAFVVDASVAVKWFVLEEGSTQAVALTAGHRLLAPTLITLEVSSAFSKKLRRELMTLQSARRDMAALPRYFDEIVDHDTLLPAALELSVELGHHLYDCVYLEMAVRTRVPLITDDAAFHAKVGRSSLGQHVVPLSERAGPGA